jgi:ferrous iron transport protein A
VSVTLDRSPLGATLTLVAAGPPGEVTRRLAELGLRRGATLSCTTRTAGGGRIVAVDGARIALGRELVRLIEVEPVGA